VVDRALRIYHSIPGCGLKTVHFILLV
jgi:hypothetical protein